MSGYVEEYKPGRFRGRRRVDGKLVSRSFTSRAEAWTWVELGDPPDSSTAPSVTRSPTTLAAFIETGGLVTAHQRESTKSVTHYILKSQILPRWGAVPITAISHLDLQNWLISDPKMRDLRPQSVRNVGMVMRRIMMSAVRSGLIERNPCDGLIYPRSDNSEMRFLDVNDIKRLFTVMPDQFKAYVPLCSYGGLRIGEAFGLRWSDVDLFASQITIKQTAVDVSGRTVIGPPKTKAGRRTVPIPRAVVYALTDHRRAILGDSSADTYVFPGGSTEPGSPRSFRSGPWRSAVRKAGLEPLRPHDLRHTAVALWIAAGVSPKEIAVRAGHASVRFSLDRYGHLFPSQDKDFVERLERLIDG